MLKLPLPRCYLTDRLGDKEFHAFPKAINPKVNTNLWVKKYHGNSSTRVALTLNNPRKLICH